MKPAAATIAHLNDPNNNSNNIKQQRHRAIGPRDLAKLAAGCWLLAVGSWQLPAVDWPNVHTQIRRDIRICLCRRHDRRHFNRPGPGPAPAPAPAPARQQQ